MESLVKPFGYEAVLRNPPIQTIRRGEGVARGSKGGT